MNRTAIYPRTEKKAPISQPSAANPVQVKLLKDGKAKGIELSNGDFIAHAFAGIAADEVPWVAGFPGDVATADHKVWFGAPSIPIPRFIRPDWNAYVCVSSFKRAEDGKFRRRKDCWSGLHMVLLDDLNTKVPADTALRLQPSHVVETSPGNFQAWLFLTQPERNLDKAEALIKALIVAGASDPGAGNLTRYGRLPTGINGKTKYHDKNGKPFTQRVRVWAPERRYTPEQIAQAYGFDLAAASKPRANRKGAKPATANRYVEILDDAGLYLRPITSMHGAHQIICPWWEQHSSGQTGTVYFEPDEQNDMQGGFKCQHGHCAHRTIRDLDWFVQTLLRNAGRAAA